MDERRAGEDPEERQGGRAPSDEQVLAALRRAMRHRLPAPGPAPLRALLEHLAIPRRSGAARALRSRLEELESRGLLARSREHGVLVFSLAARGERALADAGPAPLPESPRHRAWRNARAAADQELPRFRAHLAHAVADAEEMLARAGDAAEVGPPPSEAWLALGRRLSGGCRRLASAWHCLHEWPEPGDEALDPDAARIRARGERGEPEASRRARVAALRNVGLWREPD
jgi:hypothetical protein